MPRSLVASVLALCLITGAAAQDEPVYPTGGSSYLPLDSWVYPAVDRLAALGFAPSAFLGIRPWTRMETARIVQEAADFLADDDAGNEAARELLRELAAELVPELNHLAGERKGAVRLESAYVRVMGAGGKPLDDGLHFGQTITNDFGRPYGQGANVVTGAAIRGSSGPFAFYLRGEYQHAGRDFDIGPAARSQVATADAIASGADPNLFLPPAARDETNRFKLIEGYGALSIRKWQISFGRQAFWWGASATGPLLLSNNASPPITLRLARTQPFKLPAILSWLGPVRSEFFFGRLRGHRFISPIYREPVPPGTVRQPFIHGQKFSFKPTPNLEFGVSRTALLGGNGMPINARTLFRSFFSPGNVTGPNDPGDRRTGFDFSYRVPFVRDWLTVYLDAMADDEISPIGYPRRSAMQPGFYMSRLPGLPRVDLRAEGVYTDLPGLRDVGFFYFNQRYRSGYTNEGRLLGNWIGRQGGGFDVRSTYWIAADQTVQVGVRRSRMSEQFLQGGSMTSGRVTADLAVRKQWRVGVFLQHERWRFPVISPRTESNTAGWVQFSFQPRAREQCVNAACGP